MPLQQTDADNLTWTSAVSVRWIHQSFIIFLFFPAPLDHYPTCRRSSLILFYLFIPSSSSSSSFSPISAPAFEFIWFYVGAGDVCPYNGVVLLFNSNQLSIAIVIKSIWLALESIWFPSIQFIKRSNKAIWWKWDCSRRSRLLLNESGWFNQNSTLGLHFCV